MRLRLGFACSCSSAALNWPLTVPPPPPACRSWVGFNILGPLQNQLNAMGEKTGKKGVAAGLGLGAATLLAAQQAEAAQQVADLAANDGRFGTIALLAVPVLGWVGFNILGPLQNQLNAMGEKK